MNIRLWGYRFLMRVSRSRRIDGLWLGAIGGKSEDPLLDKVETALRLIERHDPISYRRVLRDLEFIWVTTLVGARGEYMAEMTGCLLDLRFVQSAPTHSVASTIVHEATHAHPCLRKFGYPEALRHRIETICMRRQLAFAQKLAPDAPVREEVERSLTRDPAFWSDQSFAERRIGEELEAARSVGMPDWLTKSVQWSRNWLWRK